MSKEKTLKGNKNKKSKPKKKAQPKAKALTDKQKQFCQEYLIDLNATQATIRAGYSEKTARQIATTLLSKVYIQNYISELKNERNIRVGITQDDILKELINFTYSDITDTMGLSMEQIKQIA